MNKKHYQCHSCKKRFVGTASRSGIHVTCSHCHRVSYAESAEIRTNDISPQPDEYESGQDYLEAVREYGVKQS